MFHSQKRKISSACFPEWFWGRGFTTKLFVMQVGDTIKYRGHTLSFVCVRKGNPGQGVGEVISGRDGWKRDREIPLEYKAIHEDKYYFFSLNKTVVNYEIY